MKRISIILTLFLIICLSTKATDRYFNSSTGSDAAAGTIGAPWLSIAKFNSVSKSAGDRFFFQGTFYGAMTVNASGTSGNPITITSYGTGATITGFTNVTAWTNISTNIWESTNAVSTLSTLNMVTIGGQNIACGRYPNAGWLTITANTPVTSVTSSSLSGSPSYVGGQVVIRILHDLIDKGTITAQSGGQLNYSGGSNAATNGYGFFIQNNVNTLDTQNEWYYNPSTKKIRIYSTSTPTNVQVSTVDNVIVGNGSNYLTFNNLDIRGSNASAMYFAAENHITITNCHISFAGMDGVSGLGGTTYLTVNDCKTWQCNNSGIATGATNDANSTYLRDTATNIGMIIGARQISTHGAIQADGIDGLTQYCVVDSCGAAGIIFLGTNSQVRNCFINHFCFVLDDYGGIYTNGITTGNTGATNKIIDGNIVINGIGNASGTSDAATSLYANGIYCDDLMENGTVTNNTVANNAASGFLLHNTANMIVRNNTSYNNGGIGFQKGGIFMVANSGSSVPMRGNIITNNIFFAKNSNQLCFFYQNGVSVSDTKLYGVSDSNYFAKPIDSTQSISTWITGIVSQYQLRQWRTFSSQDFNSKISPVAISNVNQLFFAYDSINTPITITIPNGTWIDVTGTPYNTGIVTLQPYTSIVLISTGTNIPPIANAGTNKNITLPTSTITQVGSGTDADGSIASYHWTQYSGPSTATIVSSTSATTVINSLIQGIYVFQLTVTDNQGATGTDTMNVIVNASAPPNQPPVVNAGGNKIITLPTSSLTQSGSATDPDGTIVGYQWTAAPTNPIVATIASPTSAVTGISGMTLAGVYRFILTATDNLGATGNQSITVTVNAIIPVPPTAHAGVDQSITWPVSTITLPGTATAGTGTIVSYGWRNITGGSSVITNPNTASTTVTGLDIGVIQFELTVTDNSGFQGKDTMQVTVSKGSASLSYTTITVPFNNTPQQIGIVTSPAGLATSTLYNSVSQIPTNAATYATVSNITDLAHYNSSPISGTFTITALLDTFKISNTNFIYDSLLHTISVSTTNPAITYTITGAPQRYSGSYSVTVHNTNTNFSVADAVVTMTIAKGIMPTPTWTPSNMTYNAATGAAQLNATDKPATYIYSPLSGFVPAPPSYVQSLNVIPTDTNLLPINGITRTILVAKGSATINIVSSSLSQSFDNTPKYILYTTTPANTDTITVVYDDSHTSVGAHTGHVHLSSPFYTATDVPFTLTITANAANIYITNYSFIYNTFQQSPTVNTSPASLPYTITFNGSSTPPSASGTYITIATLNSPNVGADTVLMVIQRATPTGSWPQIADKTYLYTVPSGILNASTVVAGTGAYNVSVGDTLSVGSHTFIWTFTPTDGSNYNPLVLSNTFNVDSGHATLSVSNTSQTYDSTYKFVQVSTTPTGLNGIVVTYNGMDSVMNAGSYLVNISLHNSNYSATPLITTLTISKANAVLNYPAQTAIMQGTALTAANFNATSNKDGTFTYNYPIGQVLAPGLFVLVGTFHPTNPNYNTASVSTTISVFGSPFQQFYIINGKVIYLNLPQ